MATPPPGIQLPDMMAVIQARGGEFALGMDIPRVWATGVQVHTASDHTLLVFREQALSAGPNGLFEPVIKNVASLVMPTDVVRDLHRILTEQLVLIDVAAEAE